MNPACFPARLNVTFSRRLPGHGSLGRFPVRFMSTDVLYTAQAMFVLEGLAQLLKYLIRWPRYARGRPDLSRRQVWSTSGLVHSPSVPSASWPLGQLL